MRVTEQIDALEASAVDLFKYLVVTRVIACMIAMPLLTTLMNFSGMVGGYVSEAVLSGMSWQLYFERSFTYIGFSDLIPATLKTVVFGFLIAIVGGYLGFTTQGRHGRRGQCLDSKRGHGIDPDHPEQCDPGQNHFLLLSTGSA